MEPKVTLEIRDFDCLTTDQEVEEAIKRDILEHAENLKVWTTKTNIRGLKIAVVKLSVQGVSQLLKSQYIKVGWVNCKVMQRTASRCYKCLGYGYAA